MPAEKKLSLFFSFALAGVAFTLPWSIYLNSISILLLAVFWLLEGNFMGKINLLLQRPVIFVYTGFFFLFVVGLLYTSNLVEGKFNLEKKLSLFALPLLFGTSLSLNGKVKDKILLVFILSCFVASAVCLANAFRQYFVHHDTSFFFHEKLSSALPFHPPYFGMYLAFSVLVLLDFFFRSDEKKHIRILFACGVLFFIGFIILLSARTALGFLILYFLIGGTYFFYKRKKIIPWLGSFLMAAVLGFLLIAQSEFLKNRITKLFTTDLSVVEGGGENELTIRLVKWKCSWEGIMENPLLGTGTGDAVDYLVSCYEKKNFWGMYPQYRFNSHNQYLETVLTLGLPGFIFFLACLMLPVYFAFRKKHFLFFSFIALFAFCCLTESLLERQQGIVFFTFFLSLFYFSEEK